MTTSALRARLSVLTWLVYGAPRAVLAGIGAVTLALGLLLVVRPLTALGALGVYIGLSAIVSGCADLLARDPVDRAWRSATGVLWVVVGVVILAGVGRRPGLLVVTVAVLLVVTGAVRLVRLVRARDARHVLDALFGAAEVAWGVMALWWLDAALVVVAVIFGARATVFGASALWRAVRGVGTPRPGTPAPVTSGHWVAAVLLLVVTGGALHVSHLFRDGAPVLDAFYDAPQDVPDEPGVLVRAAPYDGDLPDGVRAWRILYTTTASDGGPALASGVLAVPTVTDTAPPVIAWAHGTVGVARACAPSLRPDAVAATSVPALDAVVAQGWALVATDYTGMGAPGRFPYLIGTGEAYSVLDAVRAARAVARLDDRTVVWGHSQGGHAALWAGQLADTYAPDVNVVGTAALSPAADPLALADVVTSHPQAPGASLAISYVAHAYAETYDDVELRDVVTPSALALVREAAARCTSQDATLVTVLTGLAVSHDQPILRSSPTGSVVGDRLRENVPRGPWGAPLLVGHGTADEVVPYALTEAYLPTLCASGASVELRSYPGRTHLGVLAADSPLNDDLEAWTIARLAGEEARSDC